MEDYEEQLSQSASAEIGYGAPTWGASFSASAGREKFQKDVVEKEGERFTMTSYCLKYHVGFNKGAGKDVKLTPTKHFEAVAKALPRIDLGKKLGLSATEAEIKAAEAKVQGKEILDLYNYGSKKFVAVDDNGKISLVSTASGATKWLWKYNHQQSALVHELTEKELGVDENTGKVALHAKNAGIKWTMRVGDGTLVGHFVKKGAYKPADHFLTVDAFGVLGFRITKDDEGPKAVDSRDQWAFHKSNDSLERSWHEFFKEFGTHFLDDVQLGGKMTHEVIFSKEGKQSIESAGISLETAVEVSMGPPGVGPKAGSEAKHESSTAAETAFSKADKTERTTVLGGNPPEDLEEGFGEWAATVAERPMPVKYRMRPLSAVGTGNTLDAYTYDIMLRAYMGSFLSSPPPEFVSTASVGSGSVSELRLKPGHSWDPESGNRIMSGSAKLELTDKGSLEIYDLHGNILWSSVSDDVRPATAIPPYRLHFDASGDLWVTDSAQVDEPKKLWHSVTDIDTCDGGGVGEAVFTNGVLKVVDASGKMLWSSGTEAAGKTGASAVKKADKEHFGDGDNKCLSKCVATYDRIAPPVCKGMKKKDCEKNLDKCGLIDNKCYTKFTNGDLAYKGQERKYGPGTHTNLPQESFTTGDKIGYFKPSIYSEVDSCGQMMDSKTSSGIKFKNPGTCYVVALDNAGLDEPEPIEFFFSSTPDIHFWNSHTGTQYKDTNLVKGSVHMPFAPCGGDTSYKPPFDSMHINSMLVRSTSDWQYFQGAQYQSSCSGSQHVPENYCIAVHADESLMNDRQTNRDRALYTHGVA